MTIGNVGAAALLPLASLTSNAGTHKVANLAPASTGPAPAAALGKENDGEKDKSGGVGKQVNVLA